MNKKAQLQQLGSLIIPIVTFGIVAVIGLLIFSQGNTIIKSQDPGIVSSEIVNESVTWSNGSWVKLSKVGNAELTCTALTNSTGGLVTIGSANYTCEAGRGIKVVYEGAGDPSTVFNVTYNYADGTEGFNSTEEMQEATTQIPGWLPIIIIVIVGGILIALVNLFRRA